MSTVDAWSRILFDTADDLDETEGHSPKPGRVGRANTLRRLASSMEDGRYGVRFLCACGCGTAARLDLWGSQAVGSLEVDGND